MISNNVSVHIDPSAPRRRPAPVLTPYEFHEAIGGVIGLNRIYELLRSGQLRHVKIGRRFYILRGEEVGFFLRMSTVPEAES